MKRVENKVAFISGGASGIGLSAATLLAKEAAENIIRDGGDAAGIFMDAGDQQPIKDSIDFTVEKYGTITIVVNNVGMTNMQKAGGGSIINIASMSAFASDVIHTAYGSSKAAVVHLTKYIATQYGKDNIRCNAIAPGLILTPAAEKGLSEDMRQMFMKYNALPYHGRSEDIGWPVVFLASDESKFMTGQTMKIEGGHYMGNPTIPDFEALKVEGRE